MDKEKLTSRHRLVRQIRKKVFPSDSWSPKPSDSDCLRSIAQLLTILVEDTVITEEYPSKYDYFHLVAFQKGKHEYWEMDLDETALAYKYNVEKEYEVYVYD